MNHGAGMFPQHFLPLPVLAHQGRDAVPSPLLLVLLAQLEMEVVAFPVVGNDELSDTGNTTHVLLRIQRRRSNDYVHKKI